MTSRDREVPAWIRWPGRIITPISSTGSCGIRHHKSGTASNTKGEAKSEDLDLEVGDSRNSTKMCGNVTETYKGWNSSCQTRYV